MIRLSLNSSSLKALIGKEAEKKLEQETKKLVEGLKEATPVDTGYARLRWSYSKSKTGFEITNDAEYIGILNAGHSNQAPSHFIEKEAINYGTPSGSIVNYDEK